MKKLGGQRGFTLIELVVTLALTMLLIGGACYVFLSQHRGLANITHISSAGQSSRATLEQLSRELRMAGFGVIGQATFTQAKLYSVQFSGDLQSNVVQMLSANASAGATSIQLPLTSGHTVIGATDYVFLNGGSGNVEMDQVAQSGTLVDYTTNPPTLHLNTPLQNSYTAGQTLVRTIQTVTYSVAFPSGVLTRNGVTLSDRLTNLEFHYFDQTNTEMTPDPVNGLNSTQCAAIRSIELRLQAGGVAANSAPNYTHWIELRNMGNRPYTTTNCAPNPPTNLQVTQDNTCGQFGIRWTPPTTNACDGSPLTDLAGYHVYYGTGTGTYLSPPDNISPPDVTSATVQDVRLNNNQTYYVAVTAYDTSFNESAKSSEISITIVDQNPPGAPSGDATAGPGTVTLTWTPPPNTPDIRGFRVYRTTASPVTVTQDNQVANETTLTEGTTTFTDTTVVPCTEYHYVITAVDCANEGPPSNEIYGNGQGTGPDQPNNGVTNTTATKSPATGPAVPTLFTASARYQAVDLYWTNSPDSDFAGVMIRSSTTGYPTSTTSGTLVANLAGSPNQAMTTTATGLTNGTKYFFSIFAYNKCLLYSAAANAYATPGATPPVVQISSPTTGSTVTNGQLVFEACAYAPDSPAVSNPPNMSTDNGKGISSVKMWVTPDPGTGQFPVTPTAIQYCGFGGSSNPCSAGSVTQWCDALYTLSAEATDSMTGQTAVASVTVTIHDGGFYVDQTVTPTVGGTYNNQGSFGLGNDASGDASVIQNFTFTWNTVQARLKTVEIPTGTVIWTYSGAPAASGTVIAIPAGSQPSIPASGKDTIRLTFTQVSTTLTSSAASGQKVLQVASTTGFLVGDAIYLTNGTTSDSNVIGSITGSQITLTNNLTHTYSSGATLWHNSSPDNVDIYGMQLTLVAGYQKAGTTGNTCSSAQANVTFQGAPLLTLAEQDQPALDTLCSTVEAAIQVKNYYPVPTHVVVTDQSGKGIASSTAYYYVDSKFQTVAPTSGYASLALTYNSTNVDWAGTIPYNHGARVWLYFGAVDNAANTGRTPATGAYCYDYIANTTPPACPTGLTATKGSGNSTINLTWTANSEPDISGYNIYRTVKGGTFSKIATNVSGTSYSDTTCSQTNKNCYDYYITALDLSGNESQNCSGHIAGAGSGTCP